MTISISCDKTEHIWSKTKIKKILLSNDQFTEKYWKWENTLLTPQWFYTENGNTTLISLNLCTTTRFLPIFRSSQGFQFARAPNGQTIFWFLNRWQIITSDSALHSHRESWWHPNLLSKSRTCSDIFSCHPSLILTDAIFQVMLCIAQADNERTDSNRRCKSFSTARGKTLKSESERVENSQVHSSSILPRNN